MIGFCLPANEKIGPGDRFIAAELAAAEGAGGGDRHQDRHCAARQRVAEQLLAVSQLADFAEIVPVSAVAGDQVELLAGLLIGPAAGRARSCTRPA